MCGIIGFITNEKARGAGDRRKFIEQALVADTVRGDDSTGIYIVGHKMGDDEPADWFKQAADGYTLVAQKEYQQRMSAAKVDEYRAVIGHNRSATMGTVSVDNAHPFQEGPITLVHNGTLHSTHNLGQPMWKLKDRGVEVDSHAIAHNIAAATDLDGLLGSLEGTFALIWHDSRDHSINIIRNEKRPLHMLFTTCEDTVLIASEAEMLYWLAKRNNFQFDHIVTPKPMQLLKFKPGNMIPEVREVPISRPSWVRTPKSEDRRAGETRTRTAATTGTTDRRSLPWDFEKVPDEANQQLLDVGLDSQTSLRFIPTKVAAIPGLTTAVVSGFITFDNRRPPISCMVMGLEYKAIKESVTAQETWTVQGLAVRRVENSENPVVVARMSSRRWKEPEAQPPAEFRGDSRLYALRIGKRDKDEWLPGPHEEWVPLHEWLNCTADGCVQCGQMISADDAEEIEWVQGKSRALCIECALDTRKLNGNY